MLLKAVLLYICIKASMLFLQHMKTSISFTQMAGLNNAIF